jgi:hypothetical protein
MIVIYSKAGEFVSKSRNLRGIINRNRKDWAIEISVEPRMSDTANFFIRWCNGDWAATDFGSYDLAVKFATDKRFCTAEVSILPRQILGG